MKKSSIALSVFFLFLGLTACPVSVQAQGGSITGQIQNAEDSSPMQNVQIELAGKNLRTASDKDGNYTFTNLAAGSYTVIVKAVGYKKVQIDVTVGETAASLLIRLQPEAIGMQEVLISGYRETYAAGDNYSASRINAPMMNLPLSTGQVTNRLLADQNTVDMMQALKNVSGVTPEFVGPKMIVNIHGFSSSILKDGFKLGGNNFNSPAGDDLPINSFGIERIEILKGPSAILYGKGEPGGLINFISKKPSLENHYDIEAMSGSFGQYRLGASATGALPGLAGLAYRVDGSYEKSNSYRDKVSSNNYFVKPSLSADIGEKTKIYVAGEIIKGEYTPDHGVLMLPYLNSAGQLKASFAPISTREYWYGDNGDQVTQKQQRAVIEAEHFISEDWTVKAGFSYEYVDQQNTYVWDFAYTYNGLTGGKVPPGWFPPNILVRLGNKVDAKRTDFSARAENFLRVRHSLFEQPVEHGILAVADLVQVDTRFTNDANPNGMLDPFTGAYMPLAIPLFLHEETFANSKDYGFAVQDLISIGGRWHLLIGARYESNIISVSQMPSSATTHSSTYNTYSGFVPRAGLLYRVQDDLSVYASYMGSYQSPGPEYGLWDIPSDLKPERAYQAEVGGKYELLGKRMLVTASLFMVDKYDVIATEMNPAGGPPYMLYYNIGEEKAQGFDLDVVGEVINGLRLSAAFNTQTMKFTNPKKPIVDGKMRFGTPTYSGNLWALYEFTEGMLNGAGIGAGFTTRSSVYANDANEVKMPAYSTFDAAAYYDFMKFRLQLNVYNITNELAYNVSNIGGYGDPTSPFIVMPIAPFRTTFTVRYQL